MSATNETVINVQEIEPRLRHLTIFQAFDSLEEGESLVIHNNHDPKPVYYQLARLRGEVFDWEYLEAGPEWWDVKVTKRPDADTYFENQIYEEIVIDVPSLEPRVKHATIFQTFNQLRPGQSFIIHNNHDPRPVYYQLMDLRGNIFLWEYLQQGPEWWDIRVTRTVPMIPMEEGRMIINVPAIDPVHKHGTIFHVFENMNPGESFIIHNDHDPKPLFYQLKDRHGDSFTWDYIIQGPHWFDILITIKEPSITADKEEVIIDIPSIEPAKKHATIFRMFEELEEGKSFIIHNNHDPKPVYYQMLEMFGDIFDWEYLRQGPQWWDIRVTRRKSVTQPNQRQPIDNDDAIIVDVPSLEPRLKHVTIFETFDKLEPGESLIIHNDHDPKPVYYQLQAERGDVFTWEYLQQGPQWWDIRVTRKGTETNETIGEMVAKDLRKADIFKKYGIDFCCNGKKTVRQACADKGIDPVVVERELQQPTEESAYGHQLNYNEWSPDFLADYIINTHHNYTRKSLPEIRNFMLKVAQVHGENHPELAEMRKLILRVHDELMDHLLDEENDLFPTIKELVKAKNNDGNCSVHSGQTFEAMIAIAEEEHDIVGRSMEKVRHLSNDYTIPSDACTSYKLLYKMLEEFENDLFIHIHLENNILFPKAIEIERSKVSH
ncbi:MAG: iron-sulfur cluster repair di-iron protein [Saprospiraceae bacterium]|nr:iron-sulfur cluster repair di-iron protein [Saprospiraceae bacterium]